VAELCVRQFWNCYWASPMPWAASLHWNTAYCARCGERRFSVTKHFVKNLGRHDVDLISSDHVAVSRGLLIRVSEKS
jgi:hypothetical protein